MLGKVMTNVSAGRFSRFKSTLRMLRNILCISRNRSTELASPSETQENVSTKNMQERSTKTGKGLDHEVILRKPPE